MPSEASEYSSREENDDMPSRFSFSVEPLTKLSSSVPPSRPSSAGDSISGRQRFSASFANFKAKSASAVQSTFGRVTLVRKRSRSDPQGSQQARRAVQLGKWHARSESALVELSVQLAPQPRQHAGWGDAGPNGSGGGAGWTAGGTQGSSNTVRGRQRSGTTSAGGGGTNGGAGGGQPPNGHRPTRSDSNSASVQSIFKRLELVGRGAFGAVYRGVHVASGAAVALKVVNLDTPEDDVEDIRHEVAVLSQLKEASKYNVIRYWGCWLHGPELWIVMDFAEGGSVRTLMKAGPIPERLTAVIVRETLVALSYLHRQGIIHRDVKAANILLTNTGKIQLCDFGIAANLQMQNKRSTMIGTPYWMAPEVISKGKLYDQSADIWSLGITIFEMVTGNPPLADLDQLKVISMIPKQTPPRLPADGTHSPVMRDFVTSCLNEVAIEVSPCGRFDGKFPVLTDRTCTATDCRRIGKEQVDETTCQSAGQRAEGAADAVQLVGQGRRHADQLTGGRAGRTRRDRQPRLIRL